MSRFLCTGDLHLGKGDNYGRVPGERLAEQLFSLDDDNLRALIERTRRWMRDEDFPRSETELAAMRRVEQHLRFMRTAARLEIEAPS